MFPPSGVGQGSSAKHLELPQAHTRSVGVCKLEIQSQHQLGCACSEIFPQTFSTPLEKKNRHFFCTIFTTKAVPLLHFFFPKKKLRSQETALFNCGCYSKIIIYTETQSHPRAILFFHTRI